MYKFITLFVVNFLIEILLSQAIAWDENSMSRPVITRNHRGFKALPSLASTLFTLPWPDIFRMA